MRKPDYSYIQTATDALYEAETAIHRLNVLVDMDGADHNYAQKNIGHIDRVISLLDRIMSEASSIRIEMVHAKP